jgi:hypothetical protein
MNIIYEIKGIVTEDDFFKLGEEFENSWKISQILVDSSGIAWIYISDSDLYNNYNQKLYKIVTARYVREIYFFFPEDEE